MKFTLKTECAVSTLILLGIGLLALTHDSTVKNEALLQDSNERLRTSELLLSLMQDAEAAHRGYLLTGKSDYLERYRKSMAVTGPTLSHLRSLVPDTPGADSQLAEIGGLIRAKHSDLQRTIDLQQHGGKSTSPAAAILSERGEQLMASLRWRIATLREAEELRQLKRLRKTFSIKRRTRGLAIGLVVLSWMVFLWSSARRRKQEEINAAMTDQLSHYVQKLEQLHSAETATAANLMRLNQDLTSANEQVKHAVQSRTLFVAKISHDIRTPLSGIVAISRLLMDTETTPENREYVSAIQSCAHSLTLLLNDLLDLTKIEAGRIVLSAAPFDLYSLCSEVANLFRVAAGDKGVSLVFAYDVETPRNVVGDEHRLRQILTNLVSNAVKFTPRGSVMLSVGSASTSNGENRLWIKVKDTGVGIPPERLDDIFNPYEQAAASTSVLFGGTGLGLSISKHLVELMNGRIELASVDTQGSVFTISLPLIPALGEHESKTNRPDAPIRCLGEGMAVLVVDDNRVNRTVCKRILEKMGASVELAENGLAAVSASERRHYNLVLLDCHMPALDGYDTTRLLRRTQSARRSTIIAMTADATSETRRKCFEAGMDDCLLKPIKTDALEELLLKSRAPEPEPV